MMNLLISWFFLAYSTQYQKYKYLDAFSLLFFSQRLFLLFSFFVFRFFVALNRIDNFNLSKLYFYFFFFFSSWVKKKQKRLFVRFKVFRLCQRFSLNFRKRRSRSLLSLFSLLSKWKSFTKDKNFRYLSNFVSVSLICVKVRRSALFNSSMILAISFVKKYDLVNSVTIIVNCFSVSMFVFFVSLSRARKKILFSLLWDFRSQNYLMSCFLRVSLMSCSFRLFLMSCLLFRLVFSLRLRTIIAIRSLFVDFPFSRKFFKKDFTFHFIFQLIFKKRCEIFFEFLKDLNATAKVVKIVLILIRLKKEFRARLLRRVASRLRAALCFLHQTWFDL